MVDTGIFCTTAEVLRKAGANASSVSTAEAYTNDFVAQAESYINVACGYNFSDDYTSLNEDIRDILKECASSLAAIYCINYDMSGFTSRLEAQTMLDVLNDRVGACISLLKEKNKQDFINGS